MLIMKHNTQSRMSFYAFLTPNQVPWILFRAEYQKEDFQGGYLCARETNYNSTPTRLDFDDHLTYEHTPTRFLSFSADWGRVM